MAGTAADAVVYREQDFEVLNGATKESTPPHQIHGRFFAKIVDAYDGDTCKAAIVLPSRDGDLRAEQVPVRMLGYDAPEMKRTGGLDHRPYGTEVKAVFHALVLNKIVVLDIPATKRPDPYGRVLGRIYVGVRGRVVQTVSYASGAKKTGRLRRIFSCCGGRAADTLETQSEVLRDAEGALEEGSVYVEVRGRDVEVPISVNLPENIQIDDEGLGGLLEVNQWMVDNARVKAYDGTGARPVWTAHEIADGV